MKEGASISNDENDSVQNVIEDEETTPKTVELPSPAKQTEIAPELHPQPSEVVRDLTSDQQSTKLPLPPTKDVKYKKLEDRLVKHEQLSESILSTLQRIEGKCCEISCLKENIKQITTEKNSIKDQTDTLETKFKEINIKVLENESKTSQLVSKIDNVSEYVKNQLSAQNSEVLLLQEKIKEMALEKHTGTDPELERRLKERENSVTHLEETCKKLQDQLVKEKREHEENMKRQDGYIRELESKCRTISEEKEKLSSENEKLVAENKRLHDPVTPKSHNSYSVSVENTFQPLSNRTEVIDVDEMVTESLHPSRNIEVLIISDSHGRALYPKKMYMNKKVEIKVLEKGKKNLRGALDFVNSADSVGKQTLLIVGNNDISSDSTTEAFKKLQAVCELFSKKFPESELSILPVLPRPDNPDYNRDASIFNRKILELRSHKIHIVDTSDITPRDHDLFGHDKVHLSKSGNIALVKDIKSFKPKVGFTNVFLIYTTI